MRIKLILLSLHPLKSGILADTYNGLNMPSEEQIKHIADTLMPDFKPKDKEEKDLSFHFTLPPNSTYKVFYKKTDKSVWEFVRFEEHQIS